MWRFKITRDTSASDSDLPNVFEAEHSHDDTDHVIIIADKTDEESVQVLFHITKNPNRVLKMHPVSPTLSQIHVTYSD